MSRRRRAEKRDVLPDPKFGDLIVTKFMNHVMYEGKKAVAENIIYGALDILEAKRRDQGPLETFHAALDNVSPALEVKSRRVGGATYRGAGGTYASPNRRRSRPWPSAGWWPPRAQARREHHGTEKLAGELLDAPSNNRGARRQEARRHAQRWPKPTAPFSHYRW